jgi:hypothetical protein
VHLSNVTPVASATDWAPAHSGVVNGLINRLTAPRKTDEKELPMATFVQCKQFKPEIK